MGVSDSGEQTFAANFVAVGIWMGTADGITVGGIIFIS